MPTQFQIWDSQHVPYEPRAAVGEGTVLLEMVSTCGGVSSSPSDATLRTSETLPTGPHEWKVVLSGQEMMFLLVIPVSEICAMVVAQVNAQHSSEKPIDPPIERVNAGASGWGGMVPTWSTSEGLRR